MANTNKTSFERTRVSLVNRFRSEKESRHFVYEMCIDNIFGEKLCDGERFGGRVCYKDFSA